MNPRHCVSICPICGGGLCGVRVCGVSVPSTDESVETAEQPQPHGFVICDECEAIWQEPDVSTVHQYPSVTDPKCPICSEPLWGQQGRWADAADLKALGWEAAIDHSLDAMEADEDASAS